MVELIARRTSGATKNVAARAPAGVRRRGFAPPCSGPPTFRTLLVFEMLAYLVPHYLRIALPAAFFLAVFLTFRRLDRDGELPAMMASGNGPYQWLRPVYGLALGLLVIQMAVVGYLEPLSRYVYRASVHAVTTAALDRLLRDGRLVTSAAS